MSVRVEFINALVDHLSKAFDLPFSHAKIEGPVTDAECGCVWWEGKRPFARDGNVEEDYYRVRVLRRFMQDQGAEEPRQTAAVLLLETSEELEEALRAKITTTGHWFFNVIEVSPNYEQHTVEAQLTAFDRNRSATGG